MNVVAFSRDDVCAIIRLRLLASVVLVACVTRGCWPRLSPSPSRLLGVRLYPSAVEKACRYAVGIISGASLPGWKQANWCCSVRYVSQDVWCRFCTEAMRSFFQPCSGVADGSMSYEELVDW